MFLLLTQAPADHLHQLVSQHGDEQVAVGAFLLLVIDRSQPQFRLEGTKHCFQIGEHDVGAPHGAACRVRAAGLRLRRALPPRLVAKLGAAAACCKLVPRA